MSKRPKITLDNFFRRKQLCHESNSIKISQSLADDVEDSLKGFPRTLHEAGMEASEGVTHKDVDSDYELVIDEYYYYYYYFVTHNIVGAKARQKKKWKH